LNETEAEKPLVMEELNCPHGFILYRSVSEIKEGKLHTGKLSDRANVLVSEKHVGMVEGNGREKDVNISAGHVDILVEGFGRPNWGHHHWTKGLQEVPKIDGTEIHGWKHIALDMDKCWGLPFTEKMVTKVPAFYRGVFHVDEVADAFLNPKGWVQGVAWVNRNTLGRYWATKGPQLTLYVPAGMLHVGENELIVFEFESQADTVGTMSFDDVPQLNITG
jgi:beta-galactosidase